ncbi:DUF1073 domain-containing protein [Providencia stuartii]|uniref:DUF1073 domain-containing protein n=1 Tax=Providencia TaxID=586 RepID=UPI0013A7A11E|nr:DUF1073 domain-containing protein [Providencia stuartii]QPN42174.1 DUF1073 domain-containing protein [Providencia sp. 2.29]MBQ0456050.1 DUF1073 domain-containing protein [Providencia stuartii]QIB29864.1 DUF1073 domain-containing protein [Providencia stuartii]WAZ77117.1 DUF1073 domain-containing protein [Providencia stuartii]WAZ81734.1 DUF1073 domain-containing protein [Providencia stuartii]
MKLFKWRKRLSERETELAIEREKTKQLELEARKADAQERLMQMLMMEEKQEKQPVIVSPPVIHPGVVPEGQIAPVAMDSDCAGSYAYVNMDPQFYSSFIGYPTLAVMSQSSDYRSVPETTAKEMTREWGKVKSRNNGKDNKDRTDKVALITSELERLKICDLMRQHIEIEMIFGRSQLAINIRGQEDKRDLPLLLNNKSIKQGDLEGFAIIEPIWSTPSTYNSTDPSREDFFKPSKWFVLGKEVHSDRLLTLIMRPVSDILKPAYNFSGISILQLMKPYVERWQRTADSISDLIVAFSLTGLATSMQDVLEGGSAVNIASRAKLFSQIRDNRGLMLTDKDKEEFFQFNTPLSGLDALQRQAQEQMAAPSHTPLVKLLGITPAGLNANSDGEIRVYYDYIASLQNAHLLPQINTIIKLIQLNLFGEIDEGIYFEFTPLYQLDEKEIAEVNRTNAETTEKLFNIGAIDGEEVRQSLSTDESSKFSFIDPKKIIPPPFGVPDYESDREEETE